MPTVTVIDYGIGNILSVTRAFEHCGADVIVTDHPEKIADADFLVLPGVGAFADGMAGLNERGLVETIKTYVAGGRPFLGICLGMQMMMDESEEYGAHEGLGLISGKTVAIPATDTHGVSHKIPHIGWNEIIPFNSADWNKTILQDTNPGNSFYFVHSFSVVTTLPEHCLANCDYNGQSVAAVIRKDNAYGCQFHPEKSGKAGLEVIAAFLNLGRN